MKRIVTLLLVGLFSMGCLATANAESNIDVKVRGQWDFSYGFVFNSHFNNNGHNGGAHRNDDNTFSIQRVRTQVNFIISENLQAVLQFEIGDIFAGRGGNSGRGSGGALGSDGVNIETKHAYLDWMVPDTGLHIRMGLQNINLPNQLGSNVLNEDVAAVVANYRFNQMFALTAFWARPYDAYRNDGNGRSFDDETDVFGLVAPISLDGATITPWIMYAKVGAASGFYHNVGQAGGNFGSRAGYDDTDMFPGGNTSSAPAWWLGVNTNVTMFDPLTFGAEFVYGYIGRNDIFTGGGAADPIAATPANWVKDEMSSRGWYLAATLDYRLDWGTPGIFGWYASGDDFEDWRDDRRLGRLPSIRPDNNFSSFGSDGGFGISPDEYLTGWNNAGTWGLGIQIQRMSFIEDLSHTIRFIYYNGTNDKDMVTNSAGSNTAINSRLAGYSKGANYLTTKDHAYEINFDHRYQIYENLAAVLELGYISIDRSEKVWGNDFQDKAAYKAMLSFQFRF